MKTGARNISKNELKFLPQGTIRNFILKNELEKWDSFTIPFLDILLKKCTVLIKYWHLIKSVKKVYSVNNYLVVRYGLCKI